VRGVTPRWPSRGNVRKLLIELIEGFHGYRLAN
jgi:hypothetical protein